MVPAYKLQSLEREEEDEVSLERAYGGSGVDVACFGFNGGVGGEVTSDRLMNADKEPQNWLMVNKDYSSHRYSELDQINKSNVKNLHVAFTVALGGARGVGPAPRRPSKYAAGRRWLDVRR